MTAVGAWLGRMARARWLAAALVVVVAGAWIAFVWFGLGGHDDTDAFVESRAPPGLAERFYPPEGWAWGLIQAGDAPPQRYGVAGTPGTPRAQVLILPDYGESAETWFETARELTDAGDVVWVLDGIGQGGSARLVRHRDLGHLASFDADVASVRAMIGVVIRPDAGMPLVILGEGQGALVAARAVELGAEPVGLVLSAPRCRPSLGANGAPLRAFGFGAQRAPGGAAWRRDGPDAFALGLTHDRWRAAASRLWQVANPDLRMGGPSLDWLTAADVLQDAARTDSGRIAVPSLVLAPAGSPDCLDVPGATVHSFAGADPALELEDDAHRAPWLAALQGFIAAHTRAPIPPPMTGPKIGAGRDHAP